MKKKETVLSVLIELRDILKDQKPAEVKEYVVNDRFIRLKDGWIRDAKTGLEWGPTAFQKMSWEAAKKHCADLGGRLPTVRELEFLVDRAKYNPATDKDAFPDTQTDDWYWTGTEVAGHPGYAWVVDFDRGYVSTCGKVGSVYVRPVRSSQ